MSGSERTWEDLARREFQAAHIGGEAWRRFVQDAERITRLPWDTIRDRLNAIHKRDGLPPPGFR